jgi:hypothetical protein
MEEMPKLTNAQKETLAVMDAPDTAYSSASVAHKRRQRFTRVVYTDGQAKIMRRMRDLGLLVKVPDYSGDMWAKANG